MAPMGIRLSPLGAAVLGLLGLGLLYHLYSGFLAGRLGVGGGPEAASPSLVDLRELLAASVAAAGRGGAEVRRVREEGALHEKAKGKTREGADELLTSGDLRSNRQMVRLLRAAFPAVQINSEEHVDADDQEIISWDRTIPEDIKREIQPNFVPADSVTVWIDPLDATQEYTEDLRQYVTTMVCAAVNGEPVIGVIHKPFSGYTGYKVLSLLNVPEADQEQADIYIHVTYIKKWDICAGNAVLKALGGQMTTLAGEEISYTGAVGNEGGLIASINMNHKALIEKLPILDKASQN
ncbi:Golgi-resident adenosine 3',5'-bisphosphate 3'-phosphatase isoform X2 [Sceloporus undulatus]|uniref:Golgi-resident adenosine 3',5'-bisphosphate 3'-phosphatase isoform X2 n=1 Tax=Sceloporus undulatus TaxID=8520 RepID=UPI001C4CA45B|nr:Golgi-resident adenosine 3',5'-bisphosphate 3'-phosphatase isoform X2 [Sceloporus undulatus]